MSINQFARPSVRPHPVCSLGRHAGLLHLTYTQGEFMSVRPPVGSPISSVVLSVCLFVCLSVCPSISYCQYICAVLLVPVCEFPSRLFSLPACLSTALNAYQRIPSTWNVFLFVRPLVGPSVSSVCISVHLSSCLSMHLSCTSICLSVGPHPVCSPCQHAWLVFTYTPYAFL